MVRVISTSSLGFDFGGDLDADGWDFSEVPRDYDYDKELPIPPKPERGKRVIRAIATVVPPPQKVDKVEGGDELKELDW